MEEAGLARFRFGVITVSDTRTEQTDLSGPAVEEALHALGAVQIERSLVSDEISEISGEILELSSRCDAVFTTGGTGFSPRDVTPEATLPLLDRRCDNLAELLRLEGLKKTPMAYLTRGVAGMRGETLIVNLPGSPSGAREGVEALATILPHLLSQMRGEDCCHECE